MACSSGSSPQRWALHVLPYAVKQIQTSIKHCGHVIPACATRWHTEPQKCQCVMRVLCRTGYLAKTLASCSDSVAQRLTTATHCLKVKWQYIATGGRFNVRITLQINRLQVKVPFIISSNTFFCSLTSSENYLLITFLSEFYFLCIYCRCSYMF